MRRSILSILVLFTAACGGDATGPGEPALAGTYTLTAAAGESVPTIVSTSQGRQLWAVAGSLTLNEDLTFTESITWRTTSVGSELTSTQVDAGTYERDDNKLWLTYPGGNQRRVMVNVQRLTMMVSVLALTFEPAAPHVSTGPS